MVLTDNPYASSKAFDPQGHRLIPCSGSGNRSNSRYERQPEAHDPLGSSTTSRLLPPGSRKRSEFYKKTYAICTSESRSAGKECMEYISKPVSDLLISPPTRDISTSARNRLSARLHLIKCHGNRPDANVLWPDPNEKREKALCASHHKHNSQSLPQTCHRGGHNLLLGRTNLFTQGPPRKARQWPLASTYLREGALGFVGSTGRAWFDGSTMGFG